MDVEEFKDYNKRIRSEGIVMSRVPTPTREEFVKLSDSQFAGDYGMALAHLLYNYKLFVIFINDFNMKLDALSLKLDKIEENKSSAPKKIRTLNGRELNTMEVK